MIVTYEFMLAVRDCYVTDGEPPCTPEILLMARTGTYYVVLDMWSNLSWFVREADAQGLMRKLREEVRNVGDQANQD